MRITGNLPSMRVTPQETEDTTGGFTQQLQTALETVNTQLHQSDQAAEAVMRGDIEFHNAMIITEKANLSLQLTMAIRNKMTEAYQEIMRMQV